MLNLLTFIFVSLVLSLLIVFFVLFLIFSKKLEKRIIAANEKTETLQKDLSAYHTENQNAISKLEAETQRINAETTAVIKEKHQEYYEELMEIQDWCIQELKKQQNASKTALEYTQTSLKGKLEQMYKDFQKDSNNLKVELNGHVDSILKEIKAPLI